MAPLPEHARNVTPVDQIAAELGRLHKGRGLVTHTVDRIAFPHIAELSGAADGSPVDRSALIAQIERLAADLPPDLREMVLGGLGVGPPQATLTTFTDRVGALGAHLNLASRTVLRRIDTAEKLLAEKIHQELVRRRRTAPMAESRDWYVERLETVLTLNAYEPAALESRRIVATRDGLDEVLLWTDVPGTPGRPQPTLDPLVVSGGTIVYEEAQTPTRFRYTIKLPHPLNAGQSHDYTMILRVRDGKEMRPHYILVPEMRLDFFALRVKFDLNRLPLWVRRVDAEPVRVFDAGHAGPRTLPLDSVGEVYTEFERPTMYLGYGLQWELPV